MSEKKGNPKKCSRGHNFYKSSDCPACPICESERKPETGFLSELSAPARRALETAGLTTLRKLEKKTESEILKLHGMGPASIPRLRAALKAEGLKFKNQ